MEEIRQSEPLVTKAQADQVKQLVIRLQKKQTQQDHHRFCFSKVRHKTAVNKSTRRHDAYKEFLLVKTFIYFPHIVESYLVLLVTLNLMKAWFYELKFILSVKHGTRVAYWVMILMLLFHTDCWNSKIFAAWINGHNPLAQRLADAICICGMWFREALESSSDRVTKSLVLHAHVLGELNGSQGQLHCWRSEVTEFILPASRNWEIFLFLMRAESYSTSGGPGGRSLHITL